MPTPKTPKKKPAKPVATPDFRDLREGLPDHVKHLVQNPWGSPEDAQDDTLPGTDPDLVKLLREATPRGNGVSDARARILYHTLVGPMADGMVGVRHDDDHPAVRYLLQEFGRWVRGRRIRVSSKETP